MKNFYFKAILLCCCLFAGINAYAYDAEIDGIYYIFSGSEATVTYKDDSFCSYSGSAVIPQSVTYGGKTYRVTSIGIHAFFGCSGLTSISIPSSVTNIDNHAFRNCTSLTSVTIPSRVTSIGNFAFSRCSNLISITIPNSVTSIGDYAFEECSGLISITIPDNMTSIGYHVFSSCSGLTSVTIPNSVTSIGSYAFSGCSNLISITIPNSVTSIGYHAFDGCSGLTTVTLDSNTLVSASNKSMNLIFGSQVTNYILGENIQAIGDNAFQGCSRLVSITIGNSVTNIGSAAFNECDRLNTVILRNNFIVSASRTSSTSMKTIFGNQVNKYILGDNVESIGDYAFYDCSEMTSVTIPSGVTTIGEYAFSGCINLTNIIYDDSSDDTLGPDGDEITELVNGNFEEWVNDSEPLGWKSASTASNATLSKSTEARNGSFACQIAAPGTLNKRLATQEMTLEAGNYTFSFYAKSTTANACQTRPGYVPVNEGSVGTYKYGDYVDINNSEWTLVTYDITLESTTTLCLLVMNPKNSSYSVSQDVLIDDATLISIPGNVKHLISTDKCSYDGCSNLAIIGKYAFSGCGKLNSTIIPNGVTSIGEGAFNGCSSLASITIPESVTIIGNNAFNGCNNIKFYVARSSYAMFYVWNYGTDPYESGTNIKLSRPTLSALSTTQTTITYSIANIYQEFEYEVEHESVGENAYLITGLRPSHTINIPLRVNYENNSYSTSVKLTTLPISPTVRAKNITASSLSVEGTCAEGDANIVSTSVTIEGAETKGNKGTKHGLNPNTSYNCKYKVVVEYGNGEIYSYVDSKNIRTASLTLTTQQPKVINVGNVIVAAISNLDDEETNVGFEWRRTDWTSEFESNSGTAYLYEGKMEGYIRNLYTEKLWKYRPYYESDSGNRYYGNWVGIDPTNTSYFEPTVHTYAPINVTGNKAEVKGYAMRGTDNVTSQGFMYWPSSTSVSLRKRASVPGGAMVVNASGYVMTATLEDLEYETTYNYVAFVTTSEGETFYGEIQTLTTSFDPDGIEEVKASEDAIEIARYDIQGKMIAKPQKGINIIRYSDGTSKKVLIK